MVGLVAIYGVLGQGALSPGIDAAHAVDVEIDIEIDKTATLNVLGMTGSGIKILLAIVPGTNTKGLEANDVECLIFIGNIKPSDIRATAIVLRMDVFRFKLT